MKKNIFFYNNIELFKENFSEVLKKLLNENGLTQKDFAKKIGVSQPLVSFWYRKKSIPKFEDYIKMIESLELEDGFFEKYKIVEMDFDKSTSHDVCEVKLIKKSNNINELYETENSFAIGVDFLKQFYSIDVDIDTKLIMVQHKGDSMYPKVQNNNYVIAKETNYVNSGDLCIALIKGDTFVIREYQAAPEPSLIAINNNAIIKKSETDFDIIGQVLSVFFFNR